MTNAQEELGLEELLELAGRVKDWKSRDSPYNFGLTANHHFQGHYKGVEMSIAMIFLQQYYSISAKFNGHDVGYGCFYESEPHKNIPGSEKIKNFYLQVKNVLIYQSGNPSAEAIKQIRALIRNEKTKKPHKI